MKNTIKICIAALLAASTSCQMQEFNEMESSMMTFYASMEPGTRTQLGYNGFNKDMVYWSPSDEISVFCTSGKGKFVSTNTEPVRGTYESVEFVGRLDNAPERKGAPYWAVYPFSEDNTFDGESVGVTLSSTQDAVAGNVGEGLLISIASTRGDDYASSHKFLYFYNLCGVLSIPVYEDGIKKIVFKGNDNEPVAGRVHASFNESGVPFISKFDNPSFEITLYPPDMGTFNKNDKYDIVCFPGKFNKGYTIEFYRDDLVSIKQISSPVSLSRAGYVDLTHLYTGGTISSVEYNGKVYSLDYKYDSQIYSTTYWVTVNGKVFEIPEKFYTTPFENPTRVGPAVAIDTDHETVYFAKNNPSSGSCGGVIYRVTSSGYDRKDISVAEYPYFSENNYGLVLHSYSEKDGTGFYHDCVQKMSFNHWEDHFWIDGEDDSYFVDYDSSGFGKKKLSDIIFLFQEKDIPDYPLNMATIDLGLSVKWGSCNLGATSPERYGDLYAWGEISTKDSYTVDNYRFGGRYGGVESGWQLTGMTKYNDEDQKYFLDSVDDAAHVQLGDDWRIPSPDEWQELIENCSWEWYFLNGAAGLKMTSKINGNSVFFPVDYEESHYSSDAGYSGDQFIESARYHSSHVSDDRDFGYTSSFMFDLYERDPLFWLTYGNREQGYVIRPVYGHIPIEEFLLDKSFLHISSGESVKLNLTISPSNASNWESKWTSSNESVARVSSDGIVTGLSSGSTIITVTSARGERTASCQIIVDRAEAPGIVDLGLSVKWASFNVGALSPEESGYYFAWGEVEPKDYYDSGTYKWCVDYFNTLTKYCLNPTYGFNGFTDNKTVLDPEDDAAYVFYGGKWRMPTEKELLELLNNTSITSAKLNGINGYWVTSNVNGNRIFFPCTGYMLYDEMREKSAGMYWSSSLYEDYSPEATYLLLNSYLTWSARNREYGLPVRAVYGDPAPSGGNEDITPGGEIDM
jgi:hypothetical protein